jgi:uncharacterized protein YjbI with pentapeptide repeats
MNKITIFNINGSEIFSHECEGNTIKTTVEEAVKQGVSLAYASLIGANLKGAQHMCCVNLDGANLFGVNLDGANLYRASLNHANMDCINLNGANLSNASLEDASLNGAHLFRANLKGANLKGVILDDEVLSSKTPIALTNLLWSVLITDNFMRIGCERYTHNDWENFSDEEISKMAEGVSEIWKQWKEILIGMCKVHSS